MKPEKGSDDMTKERLKELQQAIYDANRDLARVDVIRKAAEDAYATALALSLDLKVGSIVSINYGRGRRRYRIERIAFKGYGSIPLRLFGRTLCANGSTGLLREIYEDWKLETPIPASSIPQGESQ